MLKNLNAFQGNSSDLIFVLCIPDSFSVTGSLMCSINTYSLSVSQIQKITFYILVVKISVIALCHHDFKKKKIKK